MQRASSSGLVPAGSKRFSRAGAAATLVSFAAGLLVFCGCSEPGSTSSQEKPGKFHAAATGKDAATKTEKGSNERAAVPEDPRQLLERVIKGYGEAAAYADSGEFHILTERNGNVEQSEPIPFSVTFVRPNKLRLHALMAVVVDDGQHFWAAIQNRAFADQVLMLPAPTTLTLGEVFADPKLAMAARGPFSIPIPQLDLLLAEHPLADDLAAENKVERLDDAAIPGGGPECYRVQVNKADGATVYWLDREDLILRRCDFPTKKMREEIDPEHVLDRLVAWAEFTGAQFDPKLTAATFKFEPPGSVKLYKHFPGPPPEAPEPPSPLLGARATGYSFVDLDKQLINPEKLRGKVVVLDMWATWCGWCFRGFPNLEKVYQQYKNNDKVAILAVSNDDPSVSDEQVKQSFEQKNLHIPIARDPQQFAHSIFKVEGLPTTLIIGPDGTVQDIETGYKPDLAEELPKKIERLLAGGDLAADRKKQYAKQQEEYEEAAKKYDKELADALVGDSQEIEIPQPQVSPRSEPATFKLNKVWAAEGIKSPGNILLANREPGSASIYVLDGSRSVAELDASGKLVATHSLAIPETTGVSFLRSGVDGQGKRYFAAFASPEQQAYVYDADWKPVSSYPEGQHPGLADVRLADLAGDGQLRLEVAYWGSVGVQTASLEGKRLAANRTLENVANLTVVGPEASGKSRLLASSGGGTLVWLDENLEIQGQIAIPNRALLMSAVDFREGKVQQICAISSVEMGLAAAVGISAEGKELWSYDLPRGVQQRPLEMLLDLGSNTVGGSRWLIAGADGTLHFLDAEGKLVDKFAYGEILTGLAVTRFDDRPGLLVATGSSLTAWRCDPQ